MIGWTILPAPERMRFVACCSTNDKAESVSASEDNVLVDTVVAIAVRMATMADSEGDERAEVRLVLGGDATGQTTTEGVRRLSDDGENFGWQAQMTGPTEDAARSRSAREVALRANVPVTNDPTND
jgi:hypothetical protein